MAQYCRYCNNLVTGNGIYCTAKNKTMAESTAKTTNNCKLFIFNRMDAFYENMDGYKSKKPPKFSGDNCIGQIKLDLNVEERRENDNIKVEETH